MNGSLRASSKRTRRVVLYAELVCDHIRAVDDDVTEGAMIACHVCGVVVRVRRVREGR